jgi:hypothetical protein
LRVGRGRRGHAAAHLPGWTVARSATAERGGEERAQRSVIHALARGRVGSPTDAARLCPQVAHWCRAARADARRRGIGRQGRRRSRVVYHRLAGIRFRARAGAGAGARARAGAGVRTRAPSRSGPGAPRGSSAAASAARPVARVRAVVPQRLLSVLAAAPRSAERRPCDAPEKHKRPRSLRSKIHEGPPYKGRGKMREGPILSRLRRRSEVELVTGRGIVCMLKP